MRSTRISRCSSPMPEMIGLAGLLVGAHPEGRVFLRQPLQGVAELLLVGLGSWARWPPRSPARGSASPRARSGTSGSHSVSPGGRRSCSPTRGRDVAGVDLVDLLALVGVHLHQPADALALAAWSALSTLVAGLDRAGVDAEEGQLADVGVGHDLERQRRRTARRRSACACDVLARLGVRALDRRHVDRRRQVVDDRVEQRAARPCS